MKDGLFLFDAHTHAGEGRHNGRRHSTDDLLREMDGFGVDRSLVIPFPVVECYRSAHDEIGRAVLAHPDRFVGSACLDPLLPEEVYRTEVRRCVEEYGFRALKFQPQYHHLDPLSARADVLFGTADQYGLAVVCHTGPGHNTLPSLFIVPARKFPNLPIVLAHCGNGYLAQEAAVAALVCPNIYLEVSSLLPHQLLGVLRHVSAARIMVGSDLPENLEVEMTKILHLNIPREDRAHILGGTASRLFGGD
jgi:predicted TIM-barrel fold metal-dependent hydrolase